MTINKITNVSIFLALAMSIFLTLPNKSEAITREENWFNLSMLIPTNENLLDIEYSAELNLLIAVGTNGTIISSTDRGQNWTLQPNFTGQAFTRIKWIKELNRFFIGVNTGHTWTSTNGIDWTNVWHKTPILYITDFVWSEGHQAAFMVGTMHSHWHTGFSIIYRWHTQSNFWGDNGGNHETTSPDNGQPIYDLIETIGDRNDIEHTSAIYGLGTGYIQKTPQTTWSTIATDREFLGGTYSEQFTSKFLITKNKEIVLFPLRPEFSPQIMNFENLRGNFVGIDKATESNLLIAISNEGDIVSYHYPNPDWILTHNKLTLAPLERLKSIRYIDHLNTFFITASNGQIFSYLANYNLTPPEPEHPELPLPPTIAEPTDAFNFIRQIPVVGEATANLLTNWTNSIRTFFVNTFTNLENVFATRFPFSWIIEINQIFQEQINEPPETPRTLDIAIPINIFATEENPTGKVPLFSITEAKSWNNGEIGIFFDSMRSISAYIIHLSAVLMILSYIKKYLDVYNTSGLTASTEKKKTN